MSLIFLKVFLISLSIFLAEFIAMIFQLPVLKWQQQRQWMSNVAPLVMPILHQWPASLYFPSPLHISNYFSTSLSHSFVLPIGVNKIHLDSIASLDCVQWKKSEALPFLPSSLKYKLTKHLFSYSSICAMEFFL